VSTLARQRLATEAIERSILNEVAIVLRAKNGSAAAGTKTATAFLPSSSHVVI
jgi:hypothetical protein